MIETGYFHYTEEEARHICKVDNPYFFNCGLGKVYQSYVKGEPNDPNEPEACYAITDRWSNKIQEEVKRQEEEYTF